MSQYPLFIPPEPLSQSAPQQWSKTEADEYFRWVLSVRAFRTERLLGILEDTALNDPEQDLLDIGEKAAKLLRECPFSEEGELANSGHALAADMGLLVSELLQRSDETISWSIVRKPKSDASYNLPVLTGFGRLTLDPIGGSIAEAHAIVRGEGSGEAWGKIYSFWLQRSADHKACLP